MSGGDERDPWVIHPRWQAWAAENLARGATRGDVIGALVEEGAGIPRILHLLVDRVHVDPTRAEPGRIPESLHELVAERGDPSGLRGRIEPLQAHHFDSLEMRALDGAADAPGGDIPF